MKNKSCPPWGQQEPETPHLDHTHAATTESCSPVDSNMTTTPPLLGSYLDVSTIFDSSSQLSNVTTGAMLRMMPALNLVPAVSQVTSQESQLRSFPSIEDGSSMDTLSGSYDDFVRIFLDNNSEAHPTFCPLNQVRCHCSSNSGAYNALADLSAALRHVLVTLRSCPSHSEGRVCPFAQSVSDFDAYTTWILDMAAVSNVDNFIGLSAAQVREHAVNNHPHGSSLQSAYTATDSHPISVPNKTTPWVEPFGNSSTSGSPLADEAEYFSVNITEVEQAVSVQRDAFMTRGTSEHRWHAPGYYSLLLIPS